MLRDNSDICEQSPAGVLDVGEAIGDQLILGNSPAMKPLREKIASVASSRVPVLILGEKGSGKEILARLIHRLSFDSASCFRKVNCADCSTSLLEECLSKAPHSASNGNKSAAQNAGDYAGTVFFDEITELDIEAQVRLLQLLQRGNLYQNGTRDGSNSSLRLICSTARNIELEVASGNFQQDLYYRISVICLQLPPVRERREDIPMLTEHFIESFKAKFGCDAETLSEDITKALQAYHWPGNIRQLQTLMKRYVILGSPDVLHADLNSKADSNQLLARIPEVARGESISLKRVTKDMVRSFERQIITKVLEAHDGNRTEAARALNISYRSLLYKVKSAQLSNSAQIATERS